LDVQRLIPMALLAACVLGAAPAHAQGTPYDMINADAARSPITATPMRGGVTMLSGSGGNIGVLAGKDGAFMVDAGIAVSRQKLEAALQKLGPRRIHYVVNTHWHWDHTDGNAWVHEDGATLVAHPNTAKHLGETIRVEEWGHTFSPLPAAARPTMLVPAEQTLSVDGETARLRYYGPSHTDGDLSVYFTKADVLFTGDTFWNGLYPFIDYKAGGSIDGMIQAANKNVAMAGERTVVAPGHGPVATRADLVAYRDMLVAIRKRVAELKGQGRTLEQTIAAKPTAPFDAKWGQAIISPALFTTLVYRGV
jgi:glyoxylase-like metal-dependent hydrolase (beta-lactamase superfamily II)